LSTTLESVGAWPCGMFASGPLFEKDPWSGQGSNSVVSLRAGSLAQHDASTLRHRILVDSIATCRSESRLTFDVSPLERPLAGDTCCPPLLGLTIVQQGPATAVGWLWMSNWPVLA